MCTGGGELTFRGELRLLQCERERGIGIEEMVGELERTLQSLETIAMAEEDAVVAVF